MEKLTRKDLMQFLTILVVGGLLLAGLRTLDITIDKIASVPLERWPLIAAAIAGFVGTVVHAFTDAFGRPAPARTPRPIRDRETEPPRRPGEDGSVDVHVLAWAAIGAAVVLILAPLLSGCGASALRVHAGVASTIGASLDQACDEVGTMRGTALEACAAAPTADEDAACVERERAHYERAVGGCGAAATIHDEWSDELVRAVADDNGWTWSDGLDLAVRMLDAASRLLPDLERLGLDVDLPPELDALVSRGGTP